MSAILVIGLNLSILDSGCTVVGAIVGSCWVALIAARSLLGAGGDGGMLPLMRRIDRISIPLGLAFVVVSVFRVVLVLGA